MTQTLGQNFQDVQDSGLSRLGLPARTGDDVITSGIDQELDSPIRLSATFPTADANLNLGVTPTAKSNGGAKAPPSVKGLVVTSFVATTVNFQTQAVVGGTVNITFPSGAIIGNYYRCGFSLLSTGVVQAKFSAPAGSQAALANPGSLMVGDAVALGYVDLQATASNAFKTAGSASNIIENTQISTLPLSIETEIDKYLGELRISPSPSNVSQAFISAVDFTLLDSTIWSQVIGNNLVNFGGAYIDFSTGNVYQSDDATILGNNFAPFAVPTGQYFWYGVSMLGGAIGSDNRNSTVLSVQGATAANASPSVGPYPNTPSGTKIGMVQVYNNSGTIQVVAVRQFPTGAGGSAGAGGSSLEWFDGSPAPIDTLENGTQVYAFTSGDGQQLLAAVKIPASYSKGNPITLRTEFYSPDSTGTALMQTVATLRRVGVDLVNSVANQRTSTNSAVTLSGATANIWQEVDFDITDSTGKINGVAVSPKDTIFIALTRGTDTGTSDLKVAAFAMEMAFST